MTISKRLIMGIVALVLGAIISALIYIHSKSESTTIDEVSLALLVLLIIVAFAPFAKSITLPGGSEVVFDALARAIRQTGLAMRDTQPGGQPTNPPPSGKAGASDWRAYIDSDPKIALAGLRIEIDQKVRELAAIRNVDDSDSKTVNEILNVLKLKEVLNLNQLHAIESVVSLSNKGVNTVEVPASVTSLASEVGERAIKILDIKIHEPPK